MGNQDDSSRRGQHQVVSDWTDYWDHYCATAEDTTQTNVVDRGECGDHGINPEICKHFIVGTRRGDNNRLLCADCGATFHNHLRVEVPETNYLLGWVQAGILGGLLSSPFWLIAYLIS